METEIHKLSLSVDVNGDSLHFHTSIGINIIGQACMRAKYAMSCLFVKKSEAEKLVHPCETEGNVTTASQCH